MNLAFVKYDGFVCHCIVKMGNLSRGKKVRTFVAASTVENPLKIGLNIVDRQELIFYNSLTKDIYINI
jgi:hypothetical protein